MKSVTDEELAERCKNGEKACEYELFRRWYPKLGGICRRFSENDDEMKDLVQESFIKIFEQLKKFRNESSLGTWMKRIATNHCINHYRKELKNIFDKMDDDSAISLTVTEEDNLISEEDNISSEYVLEAIRKLPLGYRTVLTLYAIENHSHKEISELLQISESTSKSQLFKARKMLKEFFKPIPSQIKQKVKQYNEQQ